MTGRPRRIATPSPAKTGWPVLSLFSGAGGFDLGFRSAGFKPGIAVDIDPAAVSTYRRNHRGTVVKEMDLAETEPDDLVDLWMTELGDLKPVGIIGGPPCQAFSVSNVHQSKRDPRRKLLASYAAIIKAFAARLGIDFFVFENVPGLTQARHKRRYLAFKRECASAGFSVCEKVVDAGNFGIPQHRRRLIVIGINGHRFPELDFEVPEGDKEPQPVRVVLEGLPEPAYCQRGLQAAEIPYHPNHVTMVPRSEKFTNGHLAPGDRRGRSFRVLSWDEPSYTVAYGHREIHIHPDRRRRLSIHEAMLLQGFPVRYVLKGTFSEQVELVSDALPPPLGRGIAESIAHALGYRLNQGKNGAG